MQVGSRGQGGFQEDVQLRLVSTRGKEVVLSWERSQEERPKGSSSRCQDLNLKGMLRRFTCLAVPSQAKTLVKACGFRSSSSGGVAVGSAEPVKPPLAVAEGQALCLSSACYGENLADRSFTGCESCEPRNDRVQEAVQGKGQTRGAACKGSGDEFVAEGCQFEC